MSLTEVIRVMLVDDQPVMRRGLREVLVELGGFEVVARAADGEEAVTIAQETRPDVIVMDGLMPDKDGVDACQEILELLPDTKVLMLTAFTQEHLVIDAVAAGATGFVHKYSGSEERVEAVREVAGGRLMIPDEAVRLAFRIIRGGSGAVLGRKALTTR